MKQSTAKAAPVALPRKRGVSIKVAMKPQPTLTVSRKKDHPGEDIRVRKDVWDFAVCAAMLSGWDDPCLWCEHEILAAAVATFSAQGDAGLLATIQEEDAETV